MGDRGVLERACPRDRAKLQQVRYRTGGGVTADVCPTCAGVFLDKNELLRMTGDRELNAYLRDEVGHDSDTDILCPACGGVMDGEEVAGTVVDVCLTCFGIWLDKGELDHLRGRGDGPVPRPPGKEDEAMVALDVQRRVQVRGRAAQGAGPGGAVRRRFLWLDGALDEIVRRYL